MLVACLFAWLQTTMLVAKTVQQFTECLVLRQLQNSQTEGVQGASMFGVWKLHLHGSFHSTEQTSVVRIKERVGTLVLTTIPIPPAVLLSLILHFIRIPNLIPLPARKALFGVSIILSNQLC